MEEEIIVIPKEAAGQTLFEYLNSQGHAHSAPCGGKGTCQKCSVKLLEGHFLSVTDPTQTLMPDENGYLLACRARCSDEGAKILLPTSHGEGLVIPECSKASVDGKEDFGVALDIGTTTLAAALVERSSQSVIATASSLNPQSGFGADVMSRIEASAKGQLGAMQALLFKRILSLIETLAEKAGVDRVSALALSEITVAGNPTMLHIFCGVSPEGMGKYPFTPAFLEKKVLGGDALGLPAKVVTVLPSASAFIGSDVMGGVLTARLTEYDSPTLLLDIGTNGEMVLCTGKKKGNHLFAASAAAGPALEGANISCGMGGVSGAVSRVLFDDGDKYPTFETVNDTPPRGLCSSGLVDFAAYLLTSGNMEKTGLLKDGSVSLVGYHRTKRDEGFKAFSAIRLTQQDIRELQLAKSAICAGIETLLSEAKITAEEIGCTFLAGGLGYYMDPESAARIGLIPKALLTTVKTVGNASLAGAIFCLCHEDGACRMEETAAACKTLALNNIPLFGKLFLERMLFGTTE